MCIHVFPHCFGLGQMTCHGQLDTSKHDISRSLVSPCVWDLPSWYSEMIQKENPRNQQPQSGRTRPSRPSWATKCLQTWTTPGKITKEWLCRAQPKLPTHNIGSENECFGWFFNKEIDIRADQSRPLPPSPLSAPPLFVMIYMLLFCAPRMLCAHHSLYCIRLLVHFSPWSEHLKGKDCLPFSLIFPGSRAESWCSTGQMEKGVMRHSHLFTSQKTCGDWHSLDPEAFPMCQLAMQLMDGPPS